MEIICRGEDDERDVQQFRYAMCVYACYRRQDMIFLFSKVKGMILVRTYLMITPPKYAKHFLVPDL